MAVFNPLQWHRHTRGRGLEFYATDEEVRQYLEGLPTEFGAYDLAGVKLVPDAPGSRRFHHEPLVVTFPDYFDRLDEHGTGNFWIRSQRLLPALPLDSEDFHRWLGINGAPLLQHGSCRDGKREVSSIGIVDTIANDEGHVVHHQEQRQIFESLRKRIKKDLAYASILVSRDGHEEDSTLQAMTAAAAELAREGFFDRKPGRRLR